MKDTRNSQEFTAETILQYKSQTQASVIYSNKLLSELKEQEETQKRDCSLLNPQIMRHTPLLTMTPPSMKGHYHKKERIQEM